MRNLLSSLALVLAAGCSMNIAESPPDWPKLEIRGLQFVDVPPFVDEAVARGWNSSAYGLIILDAWADADFCAVPMTCWVAYPGPLQPSRLTLAHELGHCIGYDHVGSTKLRDSWEAYKRDPVAYCQRWPTREIPRTALEVPIVIPR